MNEIFKFPMNDGGIIRNKLSLRYYNIKILSQTQSYHNIKTCNFQS